MHNWAVVLPKFRALNCSYKSEDTSSHKFGSVKTFKKENASLPVDGRPSTALWPVISLVSLFLPMQAIQAIDHTFYGYTGVITNVGCWENTRKACKPRAEGTRGLSRWTGALKGNFNSLTHFLVLSLPWMLIMSGRFSYVFSPFTRYSNSDYCDRRSHNCIHLHLNSRSCGYLFCQRNTFRKTKSQVSSIRIKLEQIALNWCGGR